MSLFLRNPGAGVRFDHPLQKSSADAYPVTVFWLAGVQLDVAQMFGALVSVLLGTEQANRCAMVAVKRGSAELVGQQYLVVERVFQEQGGTEAVRSFKEDVTDARFRACFGDDDRFVEHSKRHATPVQTCRRPARDAVEVGNKIAPREFGEPGDGNLYGMLNRPRHPNQGRFGDRRRRFPKRYAEPRKRTEGPLSWWQAHIALPVLLRELDLEQGKVVRKSWRSLEGLNLAQDVLNPGTPLAGGLNEQVGQAVHSEHIAIA